jgi:hypothetical protein
MLPKWIARLQMRIIRPLIGGMDTWEDRIVAMPETHKSAPGSPVRFEIMKESIKRGRAGMEREMMHMMPPILLGMRRSMLSLRKNPQQPKNHVPDGFLDELETYARSLDVSSIGYTRVPEQWIFQGKAILHLNAIVLTYGIRRLITYNRGDFERYDEIAIDLAPSD